MSQFSVQSTGAGPIKNSSINAARFWLCVVLLGGFLIRLAVVFGPGRDFGMGDEAEYFDGARRLLGGEPLAEPNWMLFVRAPGYSTFIAGVWWLIGSQSELAVKIVQSMLDVGTCLYAALAARRLAPALMLAPILAAAVAATYPFFIYHAASTGSEPLFTLLIAASTFHAADGIATGRSSQLLIGGVLLGVANLVRPNLTALFPLLVIWIAWKYRHRIFRAVRYVVLLLGPIVLVSLPWSVHVHNQGLGWVWVTDGAPIQYFIGHNDDIYALLCGDLSDAQYRDLNSFIYPERLALRPEYQEAAQQPRGSQQRILLQAALDWDRRNINKLPCLTGSKVWSYVRPWVNPRIYSYPYVMLSMTSLVLYLLGLFGWLKQREIRGDSAGAAVTNVASAWRALVVMQIFAGIASAMLILPTIRYRIPIIDNLLVPFAGIGLGIFADYLRRIWRKPPDSDESHTGAVS